MSTATSVDRLLEATAVVARNRTEFNAVMQGALFANSFAVQLDRLEAARFWLALAAFVNAVAEEQLATQDESAFTEGA